MKFVFDWHSQDSRAAGPLEVANTVTAQYGTGGGIPRLRYRKCLCRASDNTNAEVAGKPAMCRLLRRRLRSAFAYKALW